MSTFIFESYEFDEASAVAAFHYSFDGERHFSEKITFAAPTSAYDRAVLDRALRLAFLVIGTSYYKTFPTPSVDFRGAGLDDWQAQCMTQVYNEGLSQYAYENSLTRADLAHFQATLTESDVPLQYDGDGTLVLQSGGKDSLLVAALLQEDGRSFTPWYLSSSKHYPHVLDSFDQPVVVATRSLDHDGLAKAAADGAKNGHVPVTFIVQSIALIQAVLLNKKQVIAAIAHEGEEPHAMIGDLPVTHQWSKTWQAELLFSEYVARYVSPDIEVGSPLRRFSELKVAELFVDHAWATYGHSFSSCNRANYKQGEDNTTLTWCGDCPKCANSFLLFAPFLDAEVLKEVFAGQDLFSKPSLQETFKGLLGVDGVMKPFECVGEIDELRRAYHMAQRRGGYDAVAFAVPDSDFDYEHGYPAQDWTTALV